MHTARHRAAARLRDKNFFILRTSLYFSFYGWPPPVSSAPAKTLRTIKMNRGAQGDAKLWNAHRLPLIFRARPGQEKYLE